MLLRWRPSLLGWSPFLLGRSAFDSGEGVQVSSPVCAPSACRRGTCRRLQLAPSRPSTHCKLYSEQKPSDIVLLHFVISLFLLRLPTMYLSSPYSAMSKGTGDHLRTQIRIICAHSQDHLRTQIWIICAHKSGSSAHTGHIGWGGVGWG